MAVTLATGALLTLVGLMAGLLLFWRLWFLRDPERVISERGIVSPADGRVLEVREVELPGSAAKGAARFNFTGLGKRALMVSIFMSPLDVHVNRAPIAGTVERISYRKGAFHPAHSPAALENESNEVIIRDGHLTVGVVQIAGVLARRIRCFVNVGQRVEKGQRIGLINLGSRACLLLPPDAHVLVTAGQRVLAGTSIIAEMGHG